MIGFDSNYRSRDSLHMMMMPLILFIYYLVIVRDNMSLTRNIPQNTHHTLEVNTTKHIWVH